MRRMMMSRERVVQRGVRIVLDYDGVLTCEDTTDSLVVQPLLLHQQKQRQECWREHVGWYSQQMAALSQLVQQPTQAPPQDLEALLAPWDALEVESMDRLRHRAILRGLHPPPCPAQPRLRAELLQALKWLHARYDTQFFIVSANWNRELLRASLEPFQDMIPPDHILANQIQVDPSGITTGAVVGGIHNSAQKLEALRSLLAPPCPEMVTVYMGDSINDLRCLTNVDYGILLLPQHSTTLTERVCRLAQIPLLEFPTAAKEQTFPSWMVSSSSLSLSAATKPIWVIRNPECLHEFFQQLFHHLMTSQNHK